LFKENIIYASLHNVDATGLNLVKASNNANTLSGNLLWRGTDNVSAFLAPSINNSARLITKENTRK
jgi:hypothetical protein